MDQRHIHFPDLKRSGVQCMNSSSFANSESVHNQAVTQNISGNVYHGPIYNKHGNGDIRHSTDILVSHLIEVDRDQYEKYKRQWLKTSLLFSGIDSRRDTIKPAHTNTCQWLLESTEYLRWLNDDELAKHHGFLWLNGKPGTGKSTLTKFVWDQKVKDMDGAKVVSFFFNARGNILEKSTLGMYRALLYQLFEKLPSLQDSSAMWPTSNFQVGQLELYEWRQETIQGLLRTVVRELRGKNMYFFIDALDECDEDEARDMVDFFQDLGEAALASDVRFRTFFASRHYPRITIRPCVALTLEEQQGHRQDINVYLLKELKIDDTEAAKGLRSDIRNRASDIFLWIVLVVRILNKEYDRGRVHNLKKKLDEIPAGLDELFYSIIARDGQPDQDLIRCMQWLLFSAKSLRMDQLYFAVVASSGVTGSVLSNKMAATRSDMARFILHVSKGLVEETDSRNVRLQFIHQSVSDYLLGTAGLLVDVFGPVSTRSARGHDRLKQDCYNYIILVYDFIHGLDPDRPQPGTVSTSTADVRFDKGSSANLRQVREISSDSLSLLVYANDNMLFHADHALALGITQTEFIAHLNFEKWRWVVETLEVAHKTRFPPRVSLLHFLAEQGLQNLFKYELEHVAIPDLRFEEYDSCLFRAKSYGHLKGLERLLSSSRGQSGNDTATTMISERELAMATQSFCQSEIDKAMYTPLSWAAHTGHLALVKCLVFNRRADVNQMGSMESRLEECTLDTVPRDIFDMRAQHVSTGDPISCLKPRDLMYRRDCHPHNTPLHWAVWAGHADVVEVLLTHKDIEVNCTNALGLRPLDLAVRKRDANIVSILLKHKNTDTNIQDGNGRTSLRVAIETGQIVVADLLRSAAAERQNGISIQEESFSQSDQNILR